MKRRTLLQASGLALGGAVMPKLTLAMAGGRDQLDRAGYELVAAPGPAQLVDGGATPALLYNGGFPAPVLRVRQGERLRVRLTNQLPQATTLHWHGIRIDNAMDGVPHLTQPPVLPGESFTYDFLCPDAGTYWYHPHMHSVEQLGKGLVGVLIVDEAEPQPFDTEVILGLKDWRLNRDGSFMPLSDPRQAFRAGTLGNVATVNGRQRPTIEVPAGGRLRLRLLNLDNSREFNLSLRDNEATVIAIDGNPVAAPYSLDVHAMASGMRLDLGLIAPSEAGVEIPIYDRKGRFHQEICRLRTVPSKIDSPRRGIAALPANPVPAPDLARAEVHRFVFEWAGALSPTLADGSSDRAFWTINRRGWEGISAGQLPAPLAELELGKSYIFELHNATPHSHPIHLHGLIFTVLESDQREITPFQSDTILLQKNERAKIAFVADNPGRWMYHCHVIEHMKTGLMGYITVS